MMSCRAFWSYFVALFVAAHLFVGCTTEVDFTLGSEYIPTNQNMELKRRVYRLGDMVESGDTTRVALASAYLYKSDSIKSSNLDNVYFGREYSSEFGMRKAGFMSQVLFGNLLLKNIVARDRPCWIRPLNDMLVSIPGDYSFPSGHSMVSFACAVILFHYDRRIGIPALFLAGAIALSRLYVYVHFPTDVLLGTLIGILIGIAAVRSANRFFTVADRKK